MTHVKFSNNFTDRSLEKWMDEFWGKQAKPASTSRVPVNISETNDSYILHVYVPGLNKEDFKINLEQNLLTIGFDRKEEKNEENVKSIRTEYSIQSFTRSFTLDEKIDAEKIDAKYVNGVLTLNLPKKEEVKPAIKQISIQ